MSPDEFVFWLRGYFAAGGDNPGNLTRGDWKAVMEMLKTVSSLPQQRSFTDPTDAWRADLRRKLEKEREEFLKTLPPLSDPQWAPASPSSAPWNPVPPFIVTCEGTR